MYVHTHPSTRSGVPAWLPLFQPQTDHSHSRQYRAPQCQYHVHFFIYADHWLILQPRCNRSSNISPWISILVPLYTPYRFVRLRVINVAFADVKCNLSYKTLQEIVKINVCTCDDTSSFFFHVHKDAVKTTAQMDIFSTFQRANLYVPVRHFLRSMQELVTLGTSLSFSDLSHLVVSSP